MSNLSFWIHQRVGRDSRRAMTQLKNPHFVNKALDDILLYNLIHSKRVDKRPMLADTQISLLYSALLDLTLATR